LTIEERFDALFLFVLREKKRRLLSRPFLFPSGAFEPGERERARGSKGGTEEESERAFPPKKQMLTETRSLRVAARSEVRICSAAGAPRSKFLHFSWATAAPASKERTSIISYLEFSSLTMTPAAAATLSGDAFRALFPEEVRICEGEREP